MWYIPGRRCRVKEVMKVGSGAMKLAGEYRERGSYENLVGSRRGRGWCCEVEESSGLWGRTGPFWYFW